MPEPDQRTETGADDNAASPAGDPGPGPQRGGDAQPREIGGRQGLDPTRYGDWEKNGRCIDF